MASILSRPQRFNVSWTLTHLGKRVTVFSNTVHSDHVVHAPSQWEATIQCNIVPHWLCVLKKRSLGTQWIPGSGKSRFHPWYLRANFALTYTCWNNQRRLRHNASALRSHDVTTPGYHVTSLATVVTWTFGILFMWFVSLKYEIVCKK